MHFIDRSHAAYTLLLRHTMLLQAVLCGPDIAATLEFFKIYSDGREQPACRDGPASSGNSFMLTMRSTRLQAQCIYRESALCWQLLLSPCMHPRISATRYTSLKHPPLKISNINKRVVATRLLIVDNDR
jgi:hypothetical protein